MRLTNKNVDLNKIISKLNDGNVQKYLNDLKIAISMIEKKNSTEEESSIYNKNDKIAVEKHILKKVNKK